MKADVVGCDGIDARRMGRLTSLEPAIIKTILRGDKSQGLSL